MDMTTGSLIAYEYSCNKRIFLAKDGDYRNMKKLTIPQACPQNYYLHYSNNGISQL